jgi:hypothetical protein
MTSGKRNLKHTCFASVCDTMALCKQESCSPGRKDMQYQKFLLKLLLRHRVTDQALPDLVFLRYL